ncbi:SGNH/GDSL hydrolase family protein [Methylobacterium organophilum]|uniref:SGNH/GDSL hydrolase family protein n=1 Tax=Methylobacterium organophilum TaxID=410 RepID=UPI001F134CC3|nr:SGNH/GDSL hydrolase family protein [Methylobacterium organophilum]UMY16845.1 SGNH/GDSL hydrolase family protein [Methylobacterium organophilum]
MSLSLRLPLLGFATALGFALAAPDQSAQAQPDLAPPALKPAAVPQGAPERLPVKLTRLAARLAGNGDIRIVAFGSSSTAGAGASSPAAAYPALLQRDLEERLQVGAHERRAVTVINRGIGGDDSEAMARRLERDVLAEKPDLVVWQTGSNDPLSGVPVERFAELTRQGIAAIRATGADVVLMDQQWCRKLSGVEGAGRYGEALHAVAAELGVPVIRRHALMQSWVSHGLMTPAQMIGPDGLHMTDAGYRQLAKAAAAQILVGAGLIQPSLARN